MTKRTLAIIGGVGAAALIAVAGIAATHGDSPASAATASRTQYAGYEATKSDTRSQGRARVGSEMRQLMSNDDFREAAAKLRDDHQAAMETWWEKYGDDPRSDAARAARESLRDEQRTAMSALLKEYGVDTSARDEARQAANDARDKFKELMSNDAFRDDVNALRDKRQAAMDAWWDKYAKSPRSDAAVAAREKLRDSAQKDLEALLKKHDIDVTAGAHGMLGGGMMGRGGFGGHGGMHRNGTGGASGTASPAATQSF